MPRPKTSAVLTVKTEQSRLGLEGLQAQVTAWKEEPRRVVHATRLMWKIEAVGKNLRESVWYPDDVRTVKRSFRDIGRTFLQDSRTCVFANFVTSDIAIVLHAYGWWREWAAAPQQQHALAFMLLNGASYAHLLQQTGAIWSITTQWCQHNRTAEPSDTTTSQTSLTAKRVAALLFGPTWVSLYEDLLDDPAQLAKYLADARPPFQWTTPANTTLALPDALPADLL